MAERIIAVARGSFATRGYAGTSLRAVARDAGVDPALVLYYFTDKAGLFAAVLAPPERFIAGITAATSAPLHQRGVALVHALLGMWDDPDTAASLRSIILTAAHEPVATDRLRAIFAEDILHAVSERLGDDERYLRAGLVASQLVGVAMTRYIWRIGAIATIPSPQVIDLIAPTVQRYLTGKLSPATAAPEHPDH